MVNGFHGGEFNELNNTWVVRGENAHSWVEIRDDLGHWVILDPTPSSSEETFWFKNISFIEDVINYYDLMDYHWYKYIVHFEVSRQYRLWSYLTSKYIYISFILNIIVLIWACRIIYIKRIKPYILLSNKQKFIYWLSEKTGLDYFPLATLASRYPKLVKETREIIYSNKYDDNSYIKKLKQKWKKVL